jgi:lysozyme family protein
MAKFDELIPFFLFFECGLKRTDIALPLDKLFARAKKTGFSDDKDDAGGATMCGVTIATYAAFRRKRGVSTTTIADLKNITLDEWRTILKSMYWDAWQADRITSQPIANILVDWMWASGYDSITIMQSAMGVKVDGIVGEKTLAALNAHDAEQLFGIIHDARIMFVEKLVEKKPKNKKFLRGWKRRINSITYDGLRYDVEP